jgi:hypothetical protein
LFVGGWRGVVGGWWLGCLCCADFESELIDCAVMDCIETPSEVAEVTLFSSLLHRTKSNAWKQRR